MFGYIKPDAGELKVKELELYKSFYCGLCRCMKTSVCRSSNLTLSYDIVFLALVRSALEGDTVRIAKTRCPAHPIKKRVTVSPCPSLEYSARAGSLLACYNLLDDATDKKGLKKAGARALTPYAKKLGKKADLPELEETVKEKLGGLTALERAGEGSLDRTADCFGELLGEVFRYGLEDEKKKRIAYEIGYHVGRWIYMTDAGDDLEDDRKTGSFNPLAESGEEAGERLKTALILELEGAAKAAELIDYPDTGIKNIVMNILYLGMAKRSEDPIRTGEDDERIKI